MYVSITDNYILTSDANNIILNEKLIVQEGDNKGKEYLSAVGFYPTLVQACEAVITKKGLRSAKRTLKGLVSEHHELLEHIKSLFPTLKQALKG